MSRRRTEEEININITPLIDIMFILLLFWVLTTTFDIGTVLVVGGTGRLGGLLHLAWARSGQGGLVWQSRRPGAAGPVFDPLTEPRSFAAAARGATAILNLAGRVGEDAADLASHAALGVAALRAAAEGGVPHVFLASSAAGSRRGRWDHLFLWQAGAAHGGGRYRLADPGLHA